jgi:hypothetical protein
MFEGAMGWIKTLLPYFLGVVGFLLAEGFKLYYRQAGKELGSRVKLGIALGLSAALGFLGIVATGELQTVIEYVRSAIAALPEDPLDAVLAVLDLVKYVVEAVGAVFGVASVVYLALKRWLQDNGYLSFSEVSNG